MNSLSISVCGNLFRRKSDVKVCIDFKTSFAYVLEGNASCFITLAVLNQI